MIRSYTVDELEQMSGVTRRTISDYIARGLLAGPSHRGRGARYPQSDADALRVLPRIRTVMKKEFPSVDAVGAFLRGLTRHDLRNLACQPTEKELVLQVRRIRVRAMLASLLPRLKPERLTDIVESLSPDQIRGIDKGHYKLGSVLDLAEFFREGGQLPDREDRSQGMPVASYSGSVEAAAPKASDPEDADQYERILRQAEETLTDRRRPDSRLRLVKPTQHDSHAAAEAKSLDQRLHDIAMRLERLEDILNKP